MLFGFMDRILSQTFFGATLTELLIYFFIFICIAITICGNLWVLAKVYDMAFQQAIKEKHYLDFSTDPPAKKPFPSLKDESSKSISVVVPAYNEKDRLPSMLDECLEYLECRHRKDPTFTYEVVVVDDGSSDNTTEVAHRYSKKYGCDQVRVLTLIENRGKGCAVKLGMFSCRGKNLLFADADGATKFHDVEKLEKELRHIASHNPNAMVIGSRAHLEEDSIAARSFFRTLLMHGFHSLVWLFCVRTVKDTQCGFKLFTRQAARLIFPNLHVDRWAFDVELLFIAEKQRMIIKEVAVNWTEIEGSKLVPFWSWLQMGIDLVTIWLKYQFKIWKISSEKKYN